MGGKPGLPEENFLTEAAGELGPDVCSLDVRPQALAGGRLVVTGRAGMADSEVNGLHVFLQFGALCCFIITLITGIPHTPVFGLHVRGPGPSGRSLIVTFGAGILNFIMHRLDMFPYILLCCGLVITPVTGVLRATVHGFLVLNQSILEAELLPTFSTGVFLLRVDRLYVLVAAAPPGEGGGAALAGIHLPQVDGFLVLNQAAPGGVKPAADVARVLDVLVPGLLVAPHLILSARLEVAQVALVLLAKMACLEMFGEVPLIEGLEPAHLAGVADPLGDLHRLLKILDGLLFYLDLGFHIILLFRLHYWHLLSGQFPKSIFRYQNENNNPHISISICRDWRRG